MQFVEIGGKLIHLFQNNHDDFAKSFIREIAESLTEREDRFLYVSEEDDDKVKINIFKFVPFFPLLMVALMAFRGFLDMRTDKEGREW